VDQEAVLVDQVVRHQRPDELSAAEDHKVLVLLPFQLGDGVGRVALQKRRVPPLERFPQRPGRDVLGPLVEHLREHVVVGLVRPDRCEVLVS